MSQTIIFTDGSARNNPGPGGWGAIIMRPVDNLSKSSAKYKIADGNQNNGYEIIELGGGEKHATNNRMELMAAINGISNTPEGLEIKVFSDSKYIIDGITKWICGWKKNNWRTAAKKAVLNKDLWMRLDECVKDRDIQWKYVAGHAGNPGNERCDQIATGFADSENVELYKGSIDGYEFKGIVGSPPIYRTILK